MHFDVWIEKVKRHANLCARERWQKFANGERVCLHLQLIILSRSLQRFLQRRVTVDGLGWRRGFEVECELSVFGCMSLSWLWFGRCFGFIVKDPVCFEVDDFDLACRVRD